MYLMGLDVGTTGCKATIIDSEGNIIGYAYREYTLLTPKPGWQEIDPEVVWQSVKEVIKESAGNNNGKEISAISVSSLGEACIPVNEAGNALYNSIIYIDKRGNNEAGFLKEKFGFDKILNITGASVHPMYSINKIIWIKKNMPEVYNSTWKFMLFADFILFKLGAEPHTDYTLASRTMAFDIVKKEWSMEILDCAGVNREKFCSPVQSGTIVGKINVSLARELEISEKAVLVAGGHDQPCAALGAGIITSNTAVDGLGTVECITPAFSKPVISRTMADNNLVCVPHVVKDMYATFAFNFTAGSLLKWFKNTFGYEEIQQSRLSSEDVYSILIAKATKTPTDIFILPHFAGAATPYMDTESKGAILGLSIDTKKEDLIKAVLEGINYEMMVNINCLQKSGVGIEEFRAVGGLAKSEYFLQLKAHMTGKKVSALNVSEAGTVGVSILAGTACGMYKSLQDGVTKLVKVRKVFYPNHEITEIYNKKFEHYKNVYPAVKSVYRMDKEGF